MKVKDLSHLILAILCENRKTIGVFKNMLVSDIRNKIVNSEEEIEYQVNNVEFCKRYI